MIENSYLIWNRKGDIYYKKKDFKKAIKFYKKALELNKKSHQAYALNWQVRLRNHQKV